MGIHICIHFVNTMLVTVSGSLLGVSKISVYFVKTLVIVRMYFFSHVRGFAGTEQVHVDALIWSTTLGHWLEWCNRWKFVAFGCLTFQALFDVF